MPTNQITFTREGSRGLEQLMVLLFTTNRPMTNAEVMEALRRGLTRWAKTPEGRKAWDYSSGDFNVGDLSGYLGEAKLLYLLKQEGLLSAEVVYQLTDDTVSYDRVLMDDPDDE